MENPDFSCISRLFLSTGHGGKGRSFSTRRGEGFVLHRFSTWISHPHVEKGGLGHCLALMLVVISFTVSAKAGSERIWASTLSRLCMTVV